jgi:hypothetical protein
VEVHLSMSVRPIELGPIEVVVGSGYLERNGFYRRARSARGRRFTRPDIDTIDPQLLSDLFWRTPGVTVQQGQRGARIVSSRPAFTTDDRRLCALRPYLDGIPMFDWDPDLVLPDDLEGVEVYQGSGTPIEYRNLLDPDGTSPCGILLIWTRRGD